MNPCTLWQGSCGVGGYGQQRVGDKVVRAHRKAYADHHGLTLEELVGDVLHTCDNPPCVNPSHLRLGTHADNMADKKDKGRHASGANNPHAKLTAEDIHTIREAHIPRSSKGYGNSAELCLLFDISRQHLSKIIRRKAWSDSLGLTDSSGSGGSPQV